MKDPIVQVGDPVLREPAKPVHKKDIASPEIGRLLKKMSAAMAGKDYAVAIAAPQVGKSLRIFLIAGRAFLSSDDRVARKEAPPDKVFINPEVVRLSRKKKEEAEGCLSVYGVYGTVLRHEKTTIRALDEHGKEFVYHGSGLIAHIFQHEMDHLEGILFIDKAVTIEDPELLQAALAHTSHA